MNIYRNYFSDRDNYLEKQEDKEIALLKDEIKIEKKKKIKSDDKFKLSEILSPFLDIDNKINVNKVEEYYRNELGQAVFENLKSRFYSQFKVKNNDGNIVK